jgi:hypothetical protein
MNIKTHLAYKPFVNTSRTTSIQLGKMQKNNSQGTTQEPLPIDALIEELERELKTRKRVYPDWVFNGKLKGVVADHRISCIEQSIEVLKKYKAEHPEVGAQSTLF